MTAKLASVWPSCTIDDLIDGRVANDQDGHACGRHVATESFADFAESRSRGWSRPVTICTTLFVTKGMCDPKRYIAVRSMRTRGDWAITIRETRSTRLTTAASTGRRRCS